MPNNQIFRSMSVSLSNFKLPFIYVCILQNSQTYFQEFLRTFLLLFIHIISCRSAKSPLQLGFKISETEAYTFQNVRISWKSSQTSMQSRWINVYTFFQSLTTSVLQQQFRHVDKDEREEIKCVGVQRKEAQVMDSLTHTPRVKHPYNTFPKKCKEYLKLELNNLFIC